MTKISSIDIEKLLNEMTIEEKCGQMTQITFSVIYDRHNKNDFINEEKLLKALQNYHIGSIFNVPGDAAKSSAEWQKIIKKIQNCVMKNTRLKIPILYGLDSIHGANYIKEATYFPHNLNLAATFNENIVENVGKITSLETRAVGIPWNFSPVLDVGRQPLWPRYLSTIFLRLDYFRNLQIYVYEVLGQLRADQRHFLNKKYSF
jgi:beta-glucosidase